MAGYFSCVLDPDHRKIMIDEAVEQLEDLEFDAIAFTGGSGAAFAPILAYELDKKLVIVRKDGQSSHHGTNVSASRGVNTCIIVDDFVSSGNTIRFVQSKVEPTIKVVGIYLYKDSDPKRTEAQSRLKVLNRKWDGAARYR